MGDGTVGLGLHRGRTVAQFWSRRAKGLGVVHTFSVSCWKAGFCYRSDVLFWGHGASVVLADVG